MNEGREMEGTSDRELLCRYAGGADQDAFSQLVGRHGGWVYSAARRQLEDGHLAEDVTQAVFLLLARRAKGLRRHTYVSGWLFRAMGYCVRRAMRDRARLEKREREAATMRPETMEPGANWDEIAPNLEQAVASLPGRDRDAVLLRFYEQKPLAEVGRLLGVSEDAARMRVDRAVEKLRGLLEKQGVTGTSAGLSAALVGNVVEQSPALLVDGVMKAVDGGNVVAGGIGKGAIKMAAWGKLKVVAMVAAAIGLAASGVVGVVRATRPSPPALASATSTVPVANAPTAAPTPIDIPSEEDESKIPGQIQLTRWDMVLNAQGEKIIHHALSPMDTASKGFQAYLCRGAELRSVVADAFDAGGVERASREMEYGHAWGGKDQIELVGPWGNHFGSMPNANVLANFGDNESTSTFTRTSANHIKLALLRDIASPVIQELANGSQRKELPAAKIACNTELSPGDAVVFMITFPAPSGRVYHGMVVWETFSASQPEMDRIIAIRDSSWWCRFGPARVRQWSSIATVWKAQGQPSTAEELAPFTIKLEDGKMARLAALTMPSRWPFCWWDPAGNPTSEYNGIASFWGGDPPKGLCGIVLIDGKPAEYAIASPIGKPAFDPHTSFSGVAKVDIPESDASRRELQPHVLVGPWKEVARLKREDAVTLGYTTYRISRPSAFGETSFLVHFDISGPRPDEDQLVAVGGNKEVTAQDYVEVATPASTAQTFSEQPNFHGLPLAEVEYFKLMRRKRQAITFRGFVTEPKTIPPVTATRDQAFASEKVLVDREERARVQKILDARAAWQRTAPDRGTPNGTLRAFCNAIAASDRTTAQALFIASSPRAIDTGKSLIDFMVTRQQMHTLVAKRFGERAVVESLGGLLGDLDDDWRDVVFKTVAGDDNAAETGGLVFRKGVDGTYRIDMDTFARDHGVQLETRLLNRAYERIPILLESNPSLTIEALRAEILRPPSSQP